VGDGWWWWWGALHHRLDPIVELRSYVYIKVVSPSKRKHPMKNSTLSNIFDLEYKSPASFLPWEAHFLSILFYILTISIYIYIYIYICISLSTPYLMLIVPPSSPRLAHRRACPNPGGMGRLEVGGGLWRMGGGDAWWWFACCHRLHVRASILN
jgi:hypothetical protein